MNGPLIATVWNGVCFTNILATKTFSVHHGIIWLTFPNMCTVSPNNLTENYLH